MKILVLYATTEGQTRKIAEYIASQLTVLGHEPVVVDATQAGETTPADFGAALLAGSLHVGRFQAALAHFARHHQAALAAIPTAFVAVSLATLSDEADERAGLDKCVADFLREADWAPERVIHVAGAFRFTRYDFFKRWAMKWIAHRHGMEVDTHTDIELTDWPELSKAVDDFAAKLGQS